MQYTTYYTVYTIQYTSQNIEHTLRSCIAGQWVLCVWCLVYAMLCDVRVYVWLATVRTKRKRIANENISRWKCACVLLVYPRCKIHIGKLKYKCVVCAARQPKHTLLCTLLLCTLYTSSITECGVSFAWTLNRVILGIHNSLSVRLLNLISVTITIHHHLASLGAWDWPMPSCHIWI